LSLRGLSAKEQPVHADRLLIDTDQRELGCLKGNLKRIPLTIYR
jgi:hypothetical protein